jgi:hypothetical protein
MRTAHFIDHLDGVRQLAQNRWLAVCPAHSDSRPSLSIRQTHDRTLLRCWAGCATPDICAVLGLTMADLFHDRGYKPDPFVERKHRASAGLEAWRQTEIRRVAKKLRLRDVICRQLAYAFNAGTLNETDIWESLAFELAGYSDLEYRLDRLIRNDGVLELWRTPERQHEQ